MTVPDCGLARPDDRDDARGLGQPVGFGDWRTILFKQTASYFVYDLYGNPSGDHATASCYSAAPRPRPAADRHCRSTPGHTSPPPTTAPPCASTATAPRSPAKPATARSTPPPARSGSAATRSGRPSSSTASIDEVRVYNRALTATEIQTDMNTPSAAPHPHPTPPHRRFRCRSRRRGRRCRGRPAWRPTRADNVAVAGVQFRLDGANLGSRGHQQPLPAHLGHHRRQQRPTHPHRHRPRQRRQPHHRHHRSPSPSRQPGAAAGPEGWSPPTGSTRAPARRSATCRVAATTATMTGALRQAGRYGQALRFDSTGDWVTVPDARLTRPDHRDDARGLGQPVGLRRLAHGALQADLRATSSTTSTATRAAIPTASCWSTGPDRPRRRAGTAAQHLDTPHLAVVVYNQPIILASINKRMKIECKIEEDKNNTVNIETNHFGKKTFPLSIIESNNHSIVNDFFYPIIYILRKILRYYSEPYGITIKIHSEIPYGVGLGILQAKRCWSSYFRT